MKVFKILSALFLFFLFFLWATDFSLFLPFKIHFPLFHIIFAACCITISPFFIFKTGNFETKWSSVVLKYQFYIFPAGGFVAALLINLFVFQGIPHIQDSINYMVISQNFAAGQLHHKMHDHYEFFRMLYLVPDGNIVYSTFLPGFSIFLTPFTFLKIPFLANPLLTFLNIFLAGKIAEKLFDKTTSFSVMLFLFLSSFIIVMGGTFMAHSFCAAMTLSVVYSFIVSLYKKAIIFPVICGVSMGFLVITRPQNALFLTIPLALTALVNIKKSDVLKKMVIAFGAFLPFLLLLFLINYAYTGNFLIFKQDIYFNYSEPRDMCHRFGMGTGCPNSNWNILPVEGLTWGHAFFITYKRLSPLIMNLLLHPLMMVFIILSFLLAESKTHFKSLIFLLSIFLFNAGGYFFFYFDGNVFGPRYYYETAFFLIICVAYGFNRTFIFKTSGKILSPIFKTVTVSIFTASLIVHFFVVYPELLSTYSLGFWRVDAKLRDSVNEKGITNAVVFVSPQLMYGSGFVLMDHSDVDKNDIIYVRDLGVSQNQRLFPYYPDRNFYIARFEKDDKNVDPPVISKLDVETHPGIMRIHMEHKKYPIQGAPDYCNVFPERSFLDEYISISPPYHAIAHDQELFFCRFASKAQFYTFGQYFYISGSYKITISALTGEKMGVFDLYVDDAPVCSTDFTTTDQHRMENFICSSHIEKGLRKIKLKPSESAGRFPHYFFIDYIDFVVADNR